jgi:hypothetical protein
MTDKHLLPLVEQYRAGLDAQLMLLHRLQAVALEQRRVTQTGSAGEVHATVEDRARVLGALVTVEQELKGLRELVAAAREDLAGLPAFQELADLHKEAADLVADIINLDRDSIESLEEGEQTRRIAAESFDWAGRVTPVTVDDRRS